MARQTELILLERVGKLGAMGQVVKVRPGYARNFLLPQGKAVRATKDNLARYEREREKLENLNLQRREDALKAAETAAGFSVVIIRQAGDSGSLYGSVSSRDITEACNTAGLKIERSQVVLEHPIKALGLYTVNVMLHPEVSFPMTVNVARSAEEAERQAKNEAEAKVAEESAAEAEIIEEIIVTEETTVIEENL